MNILKFSVLCSTNFFLLTAIGFTCETHTVVFKGLEQTVHYDLYLPSAPPGKKLPVLVCTGGLPIVGGRYVHSDPRECTGENWEKFANEHRVAILGLGFLFNDQDWQEKTSYQYPAAWSGKALKEILKKLSREHNLDPKELYLFGVSAGAQFSVRYAFYQPGAVKAVAAHAAGGYDKPEKRIKTKFLITVGSQDNKEISRVEWARFFTAHAKERGIFVKPVLIPDLEHRQTELQNQMSRDFFAEVMAGKL